VAVFALVLAVAGVVFAVIPKCFYIGVPLSLVALAVGAQARKRARAASAPTGKATAAVALGTIGVILGCVMWGACIYLSRESEAELRARARRLHDNAKTNAEFNSTLNQMIADEPGDGGA
jgi:hypothetical protein